MVGSMRSDQPISGPREATAAEEANLSHTQRSPGGHHVRDRRRLLDVLLDGLLNSMWELAEHDRQVAADDLEYAAAYFQDASEDDQRIARREAREALTSAGQAREEMG